MGWVRFGRVGSGIVVKFLNKFVFHNITVTDDDSRQSGSSRRASLVGMRDGMMTHYD